MIRPLISQKSRLNISVYCKLVLRNEVVIIFHNLKSIKLSNNGVFFEIIQRIQKTFSILPKMYNFMCI